MRTTAPTEPPSPAGASTTVSPVPVPAPAPSSPPQRSHSWIRTLSVLAAGVALVASGRVFLSPPSILGEVAYVKQGSLQITLEEEGRTRVQDRFILSAPVTGRLHRISWEPGDPVVADQVLAQIDPLPYTTSIQSLQAELEAWQAQQAGVETLRPKAEALNQAQARIQANQALLQVAEAERDRAAAALQQAERDRHRAQELEAAGVLSREQREVAELEETTRRQEWQISEQQVQSAQAQIAMAEADLAVLEAEQSDPDYLLQVYAARIAALEAELIRLQDDVAQTEIRSPITGQILRVLQSDRRMVTAGTPVLELGDPQDLELVVDVLSQDALQIETGDPVWIDLETGERILVARVSRVEPAAFTKVSALGVEEQRVNVIADFVTEQDIPSLAWGDGYRVDVHIGIWEESEILKVPTSALFRCRSSWCVFRIDESGVARQRLIELGPRNDQEAAVLRGLSVYDPVLLYPSEEVEEGVRVRIREHQ